MTISFNDMNFTLIIKCSGSKLKLNADLTRFKAYITLRLYLAIILSRLMFKNINKYATESSRGNKKPSIQSFPSYYQAI